MAAYRKFSEARWPTAENRKPGCPSPKAPKPPKAETEVEPSLGALGGLGGGPVDFQKSGAEGEPGALGALGGLGGAPVGFQESEAESSSGTLPDLAATAGVTPGGSGSASVRAMEQNENTSLLAQATKCHPGPGAKNGRAPPEAENQNTGGPPPKAPKSPKVNAVDDLTARAAIIEQAVDVSRRWAEAYAALCAMQPPAGFSPERWRQVVDAAGIFLDRWGGDAIRCGWSDLDVFGCHPDRPAARIDCMGLVLLLDRCRVVSVDPDGADLVTASGARQRHYRRPLPPGTVALWELGR